MTTFQWTCSYMGCRWYRVTDSTGSYKIEERWQAGDYELSISKSPSGDFMKDCRVFGA
jgi:hypothetical protein